MVTAFSTWIMNFGQNGFTEYIVQKDGIDDKEISTIFWTHLIIASCLALLFVLFGMFLVSFYREPALRGISNVMALTFIMSALYTSHLSILKRNMKFGAIATIHFLSIVIGIALAVPAALKGYGYWAVVIRQISYPAVTLLGGWLASSWRPKFVFLRNAVLPILRYAIHVYSNFTLGYLTKNIDKVLLGKFYGADTLGNYERAYQLSMLPANQVQAPLNSVALSTLSKLKNDPPQFISYYLKAVSVLAFIGTALAVVLTFSAQDLILLILGEGWKEAGTILLAFTPGILGMIIYSTHSWIHLSLGTPDRWLKWNILASIITILAFVIALPYGAVAMGIAFSVRSYALIIPGIWYAGRNINLRIKPIIASIWPYFVSSFIVFVAWYLLLYYYSGFKNIFLNLDLLYRIGVKSIFSLLLYVVFVVIAERSFRSINQFYSLFKLALFKK